MVAEEEDEALWWHAVRALLTEGRSIAEAIDGANILVMAQRNEHEQGVRNEDEGEQGPRGGAT